jgi:hypothetical protein
MNYEYRHYGKTLDKLSKKEAELLVIDTSMTLMFKMQKQKDIDDNEVLYRKMINDISIRRTNIILDILNLNEKLFSSTIQKLDYIETTDYGFDKFLKDVLDGKFEDLKMKIEAIRKKVASQHINYFTYGFDEYYTNNILIKELIGYKTMIYYSISLTTIEKQYPGIIKNFKQIEKNETELWNHFHPGLNLKQKKEFETDKSLRAKRLWRTSALLASRLPADGILYIHD